MTLQAWYTTSFSLPKCQKKRDIAWYPHRIPTFLIIQVTTEECSDSTMSETLTLLFTVTSGAAQRVLVDHLKRKKYGKTRYLEWGFGWIIWMISGKMRDVYIYIIKYWDMTHLLVISPMLGYNGIDWDLPRHRNPEDYVCSVSIHCTCQTWISSYLSSQLDS